MRHIDGELGGVFGQFATGHPQPHGDFAAGLFEQAFALGLGGVRDPIFSARTSLRHGFQGRQLRGQLAERF